MISNKHIKKTDSENANGHFLMPVQNDPACEWCYYYRELNPNGGNAQKACHYMLIEGRRRPCEPGAACTEKKSFARPEYDRSTWGHGGRAKEEDDADL